MIKAVLLDLDETLLRNPPDVFVAAYITSLIPPFVTKFPHLSSSSLKDAMLQGVRAVVQNQNPLQTNGSIFNSTFAGQLNILEESLPGIIETYVMHDHPHLRNLTESIAVAPHVVSWLHQNDYAVVIATNPLFPFQAVQQRVEWTGIDTTLPWLITALDNVHFTKPNPAYYEEILSNIGFEPDETLMVGDDWENDIVPATQAGLNTYWIRPAATPAPQHTQNIQPTATGTLAEFFQLITEQDWLQTLSPLPLQAQQIAPRLLGNVASLHGTALNVPDHFWHQHPDPNEWSPLEVVVHMLESECTVQRPRLQKILSEDNPFLTAPPEPPAPGERDITGIDPEKTIQQFALERQKTIELLSSLSDSQWIRSARHSVFGPTNLLEMAAFTARHDRLHINQLCQTIGKCR